jgi:PEP-CTERM motif
MLHRLAIATLLISMSGLLARPASAEITSVSASGPGGTVSSLVIDTTFNTDDSVSFDATYTSAARIVLTLTLNGSGDYFIGPEPSGVTITNDTSASFPLFHALLVGAPTGVTFNEASWFPDVFSGGAGFIPSIFNATEVTFFGPPGIGAGDSSVLNLGILIPDSVTGSQTFEVVLTPSVASVPEPSTWAMMLLGFVGLGYAGYRASRKSAALATS